MTTRIRNLQRFVRAERAAIRERLAPELTLDTATYLVVEPYEHLTERVSAILRSACPPDAPQQIFAATDASAALGCAAPDVWLAVVCVDHPWLDALALCDRLRYRFPHAQLVGRSVHDSPLGAGTLSQRVDWLVGAGEVESYLPSLVDTCRLHRRHLLDRLVESELGERVVAHFGPDAAALAGIPAPARVSVSLDEAKANALRVALAEARGNVAEAARRLGVDRSTVYRWRDKFSFAG